MVFRVALTMLVILMVALFVCHWSPHTAYRVLQHSQHLFEPDDLAPDAPKEQRRARFSKSRGYLSPPVKKRVAAGQQWRSASCKSLLDETYELDHVKPLFRGGANAESNLQALCKRCHAMKSALEQSKT